MLVRITGPSVEPVTLDEVKTRFDIDYDDHDDFLRSSISAARRWVENRTGRALVEQEWEYRLADFETEIGIPMRPVISVTSVKYVDDGGDEQTVDDEDYFLVAGGAEAESILMPTDEWPTDAYARPDAVRIRFLAGYEADDESPVDLAGNVPDDLKAAIMMHVGHLYENREAVLLSPVRQELQVLPLGLEELIAPYIIPRL